MTATTFICSFVSLRFFFFLLRCLEAGIVHKIGSCETLASSLSYLSDAFFFRGIPSVLLYNLWIRDTGWDKRILD